MVDEGYLVNKGPLKVEDRFNLNHFNKLTHGLECHWNQFVFIK